MRSNRDYSFVGDDYPLELPLGHLDKVALTLHESIHYDLNLSDPIAEAEWIQLAVQHPGEFGRSRLGQEHRIFSTVFYHQLHCLRNIEIAILKHAHPVATREHFGVCS